MNKKNEIGVFLPVKLVQKIGETNAALFLSLASFLSSISKKKGGWFDLPQTGAGSNNPAAGLFEKLGSFEYCLKLSPVEQLSARAWLKSKFPGILQEKRKGTPPKLHYFIDQAAYLSLFDPGEGGDKVKPSRNPAKTEIPCPHQEIIDLYHESLPTLSRIGASRWDGSAAATHLTQRWREGLAAGRKGVDTDSFAFQTKQQGMDAMKAFFGIVARSPWLLGDIPNRDGKKPFVADLRWLVNHSNFDKVLQGNYQDLGNPRPSAIGCDAVAYRKPSRLGLKPGETYDRFADFSTRGEFQEDDQPNDKRMIIFDGGVYLFGEDLVLLEAKDGLPLVQKAMGIYNPFGCVARVSVDKLPRKVEIMRRCRINGLVNDAPDMVIPEDELPVFGVIEEEAA